MNDADSRRNFRANDIDQIAIENVPLRAWPLFDNMARSPNPYLLVNCRGPMNRLRNAGHAQQSDLRRIELLAAKIIRVNRMRVDDNRVVARAPQHDRSRRTGET